MMADTFHPTQTDAPHADTPQAGAMQPDSARRSASTQTTAETAAHGPTRRHFLQGTGAVVGAAALGGMFIDGADRFGSNQTHGVGDATEDYNGYDVIYSMCMQCNAYCTIKVRLSEPGKSGATSLVRKISGNPYSPLNTQPLPAIPYSTPPQEAMKGLGTMAVESKSRKGGIACAKGQAGIQIVHDSRRVKQPLKRVGERGSGKWKTISWDQALKEILEGAADIGTPGLKSWWAFAPEKPVMADWDAVQEGTMSQADFEAKWADKLIDPKHPQIGPKSNLMAFLMGEKQPLLGVWFANQVFGTMNQFNHGGTCGMSGVQSNVHEHPTTKFKRMYIDIDGCDYLIVWGTEPTVAQKGPTWMAPRIGAARERGMKLVVVDPRMSKTAEKADVWMPVRPGADIDLAFAMIQWIIDNKRYDERYLRAPSQAAAEAIGEPTWSDATHLVNMDDKKRPKINAWALGLMPAPDDPSKADPEPMVLVNGQLQMASATSQAADLDVDTVVNGKHLRSVFNLLKERVHERSFAQYAELAGIEPAIIEKVASEFTAHGKRAGVMSYRGPAMHFNGYDSVRAVGYLNMLIGNWDWKGGHIGKQKNFAVTKGHYDIDTVPNANKAWGYPITREKVTYEKTPFFKRDGYPAKRRWVPFTGNACHEVIPSAVAGYPYFLKALFISRHSPLNSSPGAGKIAEQLKRTDKIELIVVSDVTISDTGWYADYILPDLTYLEKFGQESVYPSQQYACTQFGQPTTRAFEGPRTTEEVYLALAKQMGLPGVGEGAFKDGSAFNKPEDFWLKMAANIAYGVAGKDKPVADASAEEMELFERTRTFALGKYFDLASWKAAVGEAEWPKVVTVLDRGGRFKADQADRADGYDPKHPEWLKFRYAGMAQFYDPKTAQLKDCITGKFFEGIAAERPVTLADGTELTASEKFPLQMVNWKARTVGTYRTENSAWLRELTSENFLWISAIDAEKRGIKNGDRIRITSPTSSQEGRAYVLQGIRPGVVGADSAYGMKGYGATDVEIDGTVIPAVKPYGHGRTERASKPGEEETGFALGRGLGIQVNAFLPEDTQLGGGGLVDPIGGGAVQLDAWVQVEKI